MGTIIGELVRIGSEDWSLMLVDSVVEEEWGVTVYGTHLMGGRISAPIEDLSPESEEDWDRWDSCARYRRRGRE